MKTIQFLFLSLPFLVSCGSDVLYDKSLATLPHSVVDSMPESEINIPIQINLKPFFALAEKEIDTVFTSPNWPDGWIEADCATRFKYHFRRSPLSMHASGNELSLAFTGHYKVMGSTRVCVGNTVLSLWTPPCRCGFDEGERKVQIRFNSSFSIHRDHTLRIKINRAEPKALNKCTVCFWSHDVTALIIKGLQSELDQTQNILEKSFSVINLKPYLQEAWHELNRVYTLNNLGYLSLHPKKIHIENMSAENNLLNINIGLTATPLVSFELPELKDTQLPDLSPSGSPNNFNIYVDAVLQYDSLSRIVNQYLKDRRFDFSQGPFQKHVIIRDCQLSGNGDGKLKIKVDFTGSHSGTAYFVGQPVYDSVQQTLKVNNLNFDLRTRDMLLKTARWLFNRRIIDELHKYTTFNLSGYYETASNSLQSWLNKEWAKGLQSSGTVNDLKLTGIYTQPQHLVIRSNCSGHLTLKITDLKWSL